MVYYKKIYDISELPNFDKDKPVFCDIETGGLYIEPRLIQFLQGVNSEDNPVYILDLAPSMRDIPLLDSKVKEAVEFMKPLWLVFYNGSYDLGTLNFVPAKVDDLFYATKTAYPHFMEFSLDKVTQKLRTTRGLYNNIDKKEMHSRGFKLGAYLSKKMYLYSAIDVVALQLMWEDSHIQNVIQNNLAYKVDILSLRYAIEYQQNGLKIPVELVREEIVKAQLDVDDMQSQLPQGLNVNSPKQVREYLGTEGSAKDVLLRCSHPHAEIILKLKKRKKELSYLNSINYDTMYTRFNPAGAVTGRFTSSGGDLPASFNAQQIPRAFQYIFKQDIDDTTVVGLDYATLELRVAASLWGISKMREFFKQGIDLHIKMAMLVSNKELCPEGYKGANDRRLLPWGQEHPKYLNEQERNDAKMINFGLTKSAQVKDIELLGNLRAVA